MRRHLVTKGSFYERLAEHGHEVFGDSDFAELSLGADGAAVDPRRR